MSPAYRKLRAALGLLVTSLFLWLVFSRGDVRRTIASVTQVSPVVIACAVACLAAGYSMRVVRWWWMLRSWNLNLSTHVCFWPLIVSVSVNNVVPFRAGDALRVFGFREQLGVPAPVLLGTLLVERLLDITVLLGLLLGGLFVLHDSDKFPIYRQIALVVAGVSTLAWILIGLYGERLERVVVGWCQSISAPWARAGERHVIQLFRGLDVVRTPAGALQLFAMSVVAWACEGAVYAVVANGVHYDGKSFGPWFACAAGTLSTLIPSSPGYIGTFDYFAMSGLIAYGASRILAGAFAFLVHAVLWVPLTAAGLIYMLVPKLRPQPS